MLVIGLGFQLSCAEVGAQPVPDTGAKADATLIGRFLYDGEPPEPRLLQIPLRIRFHRDGNWFDTEESPGRRRIQERGVLDESLIVGEDRGIANVVIWVRSKDIPIPPRDGLLPPATVRAEKIRFKPHILAFWNVTPLIWANESGSAVNFNLGSHRNRLLIDGQRIEIEVKSPLPAAYPLTSNIQPWFKSYVFPLGHPYFAVTQSDGRFKIEDLPLGDWEFVVWHERVGWLPTEKTSPRGRFHFTIKPGENDLGDVSVKPELLAPRLVGQQQVGAAKPKLAGKGNTLSELHHAASKGHSQRVRELIAAGGSPHEREPRFNGTPLHYAARHGHGEVVQALIECGARIDARDTNDCMPLVWAVKGGHSDVMRRLLDAKADVDARDSRGWTALHFAVDRGHDEAAQLLIDRGADLHAKNRDGKSPLELNPALNVLEQSQPMAEQ
jgi:hypothetical protein